MDRAKVFKQQLTNFAKETPFNALVNNVYNIRAYVMDKSNAGDIITVFIYTYDTLCRRGDILVKDNRKYLVTNVKYIESKGYDAIAATLMEEEFYVNDGGIIFSMPFLADISSSVGFIRTFIQNSDSQAIVRVSTRHPNFGSLAISQEIFIGGLKYRIDFIDTSVEGLATLITTKIATALGDDKNIGIDNRGEGAAWSIWETTIAQGEYVSIDSPLTLTLETSEDSIVQEVDYIFYSDRPEIATVDQYGTIIPISEGAAVISVASLDSNGIPLDWAEIRVVTEITPMQPGEVVPVNSTFELNDIGQTFTVMVRTTNSEGVTIPDSYQYIPSDPTVCSVDSFGVVTALGEGVCEIQVVSNRFPTIFAVVTITVRLIEIIEWKVETTRGTVNEVGVINGGKTWTIQKYRNGIAVDSGFFNFTVSGDTSGFKDFTRQSDNSFHIAARTAGKTINVYCNNTTAPFSVNILITSIYTE